MDVYQLDLSQHLLYQENDLATPKRQRWLSGLARWYIGSIFNINEERVESSNHNWNLNPYTNWVYIYPWFKIFRFWLDLSPWRPLNTNIKLIFFWCTTRLVNSFSRGWNVWDINDEKPEYLKLHPFEIGLVNHARKKRKILPLQMRVSSSNRSTTWSVRSQRNRRWKLKGKPVNIDWNGTLYS